MAEEYIDTNMSRRTVLPTVLAQRHGNVAVFYCPDCRRECTHGCGNGHRVTQCDPESPWAQIDYIGSYIEAGGAT